MLSLDSHGGDRGPRNFLPKMNYFFGRRKSVTKLSHQIPLYGSKWKERRRFSQGPQSQSDDFITVVFAFTRQGSEVQILPRLPGKARKRAVHWMAFLFLRWRKRDILLFCLGSWASAGRSMNSRPMRRAVVILVKHILPRVAG